jgi:uncharacterized protein (TIGR02594 family)
MAKIPSRFDYLLKAPYPPVMTRVAMGMYGTYELSGGADNPLILAWADEVAKAAPTPYNNWAADFYNDDAIPWCGLFQAVCAVRSSQGRPERMPPKSYLSALAWANWGVGVPKKLDNVRVGDTMVLVRKGGGHVCQALAVTEKNTFFGLGGNQSNAVNVQEFPFSRVYAIRRPPYIDIPDGARHIVMGSTGIMSGTEQ